MTIATDRPATPPRAAVYWALNAPRPADHPVDASGRDCNDYAHAAFLRLQSEGRHPRYLVAIIPDGEAHMIVDAEGIAYDNLLSRPRVTASLPYDWRGVSPDGIHWWSIKK